MARHNSRMDKTAALAQAASIQRQAEAIEEPMKLYRSAAPGAAGCCLVCEGADALAFRTQVLEQLSTQNQLLVDLLSAVNSLTAATLCRRAEP